MRKPGRKDKKRRHAGEMARCLRALEQMNGVLWLERGQLWILHAPAAAPSDPRQLARLFWSETLPQRREMQRALGCPGAHAVTAAQLAAWSRAWSELDGRPQLADLAAEGVRPLRKYRGRNLPDQLGRARARLDQLIGFHKNLEAVGRCASTQTDDWPAVPDLVAVLPLRLAALGTWQVDPLAVLTDRALPADRALLALARSPTTEACLARLAVLLLSQRHERSSTAARQAIEDRLPPLLRPIFRIGATAYGLPWTARFESQQRASALPPAEAARIGRTCDRLAQVFGLVVAQSVCDNLTQPWLFIARTEADAPRLAGRLLHVAQVTLAGSQLSASDEVTSLHRSFQQERLLTNGRHLVHSTLSDLVASSLADSWPENTELCDKACAQMREVTKGDILMRLAVMTEAWQEIVVTACREHVADEVQRERLTLCLVDPQFGIHVPPALPDNHLRALFDLVVRLPPARFREVMAAFDGSFLKLFIDNADVAGKLFESVLPLDLVRRAIWLKVAFTASEYFPNAPGPLHRYLECVEALGEDSATSGNVTGEEWFARLFLAGRGWVANVALALLGRVRRTGEPADVQRLYVLSEMLGRSSGVRGLARQLDQALHDWDTPQVERPPAEMADLADALGVSTDHLITFLHHRRLAGHDETFPQTLLEPLRQRERNGGEAAFLEQRLGSLPLDHPQRDDLARRLHNLNDPDTSRKRHEATAARARRRLDRSMQQLCRQSLDRVLADVCRVCLERLLKRSLPPESLSSGILDALVLLEANSLDHPLLIRFLEDILDGRPLADWPANRAWLDRAAAAGVDVAGWLAGLDATVTLDGQSVRFWTEKDPLRVLQMGSLFSTCLSLGDGCNAASTLTNAIEVNKQVVYASTAKGTIIARKLIGTTAAGRLAGYRTYTNRAPAGLPRVLDGLLADLAWRCRLQLSDTAVPEKLHDSAFWYDDGNEPWDPLELEPAPEVEPSPDVPPDAAALQEWRLRQARAAGNTAALIRLARTAGEPWSAVSLFHLLHGRLPPARPDLLRTYLGRHWYDSSVTRALTYLHGLSWTKSMLDSLPNNLSTTSLLDLVLPGLPFDRNTVMAALRQLTCESTPLLRRWLNPQAEAPDLPAQLSLAPLDALLRFFAPLLETWRPGPDWRGQAFDILEIAWLRDQDHEAIVRALGSPNIGLVDLLVRLAGRVVIPGAARKLRGLLPNCPAQREDKIALALGTQGDPQDGERLLKCLRCRPDSLLLAVAVVRTQHPRAAQAAHELWQPPEDWFEKLDDPCWLALVREVGSNEIGTRLQQLIDKGGSDCTHVKESTHALRLLALLGLPGPEGEPAQLLKRRRLPPALWASVTGCQQLWQKVRTLDRRGEELLAPWADLQSQLCKMKQPGFRHFSLERHIRCLAAHGTADEQSEALQQWLDMDDNRHAAWRAKLLAGLAQSADTLEILARRLLTCPQDGDGSGADLVLRALATESAGRMQQSLEADGSAFFSWSWTTDDAWDPRLLALLAPDPMLAEAARTCLRLWAKRQPLALLGALNQAFILFPAATVERLLADVMPHLDVDSLWVKGLLVSDTSDWPTSYAYQQWVLREIWPRLGDATRRAALDDLRQRKEHSERAAWLLRQLEPEPLKISPQN